MNREINSIQVRRAFRMAQILSGPLPLFIFFLLIFIAVIVAMITRDSAIVFVGLIIASLASMAIFLIGIRCSRCPQCGQRWGVAGTGVGPLVILQVAFKLEDESGFDERETYTCRQCGLEIGPHLRK